MKLKHKATVRYVYPDAVCHHVDGEFKVIDKEGGRVLGGALSTWGAWADAYRGFSKADRAKIPMALMEGR